VREYVATEIAQQLRPQFEAAVKANDAPAGEPYTFSAAACAKRAIKNKAMVGGRAGLGWSGLGELVVCVLCLWGESQVQVADSPLSCIPAGSPFWAPNRGHCYACHLQGAGGRNRRRL
jgi:hypothetical protein